MKHIVIKTCEECPYCSIGNFDFGRTVFCRSLQMMLNDFPEIPINCKLEDV